MSTNGFDPQAGFLVVTANDFAKFNEQTLVDFYQPILGAAAFSLFYALKAQLLPNPTLMDRQLQSQLLIQTNMGQRPLQAALHRLEGVSLVRTYFRQDSQGKLYVYELHPTATPDEIVDDDLLSVLLLEAVGEQRFNTLVKRARQYQLKEQNDGLQDISHNFFDEFQVAKGEMMNTPATIMTARLAESTTDTADADHSAGDIDWSTLLELLNGQPVIRKDLENHQKLINTEHLLYGISEPDMKRFIEKATDLKTNHFDPKKFRRIVANAYRVLPVKTESKNTKSVNSVDQTGLTDKDQELLVSAQKYSPVDFLQLLKEQTGGYVTSGERYILQRLVNDQQLTQEMINILSWYIIADQGNATLPTRLVDAIANNWLRAKVSDGPSALKYLKDYRQGNEATQGKKKRKYYPGQRIQVRETMPDWSKKDKKASPEAIAKAKARLKKNK